LPPQANQFQGQKVKVTRPINAEIKSVSYLSNGEASRIFDFFFNCAEQSLHHTSKLSGKNQQNVTEIILYFCSIITFRFLPLASCLLTVPRCHRSSTEDASQLCVTNVLFRNCASDLFQICVPPLFLSQYFYQYYFTIK